MDSANVVNILTGKRYCKTILTIHGFHPSGWINRKAERIVDFLMRVCYCRADEIVTVSKGLMEEMRDKYDVPERKIRTIYNGYPVNEIQAENKQKEIPRIPWGEECDIIITSGRTEKVKGQWHLIKAFSIIATKYPRARLVILGDGVIKKKLEQLVVYYGLEDKVFMPGFVKNPFAFFSRAKVFVLPSLSEGYPNAIAEAMICGLPCVSADCVSGPREILGEGEKIILTDSYEITRYGILTPAFDMDDLWDNREIGRQEEIMAEAILKLLMDENCYQELKDHIPEKIEDFSMEKIISQWEEICLA
jgi:glycosyltransferase involved in cell wall biosynthesis